MLGFKGRKLSEEHRRNIGLAHKGKKYAPGRISGMKGKKHSEATKKKIGKNNGKYWKGKKRLEETRKKISETLKGQKPWNVGKTGIYSEEQLEKMRGRRGRNLKMSKIFQQPHMRELRRKQRLEQVFPKKDSKIELIIQDLLRKKGIEFEKHKPILGQPDLFIEPNICIFADGGFHHASPSRFSADAIIWKERISKTSGKHMPAVTAKMIWKKDRRVTQTLEDLGHTILRFWGDEIRNEPEKCFQKIIKAIKESKR